MYNKKILSKAVSELGKAKAPAKAKDIITDPMGQWKYPGLPTRIPGNDITMKGVGYPVLGVANNGQRKIMLPGADYTFPGAKYVDEYPQMKKGGAKKRKTKSLSGTNKIMQKNPLFKNYKSKMYDPNVDYFQDGGDVSPLEGDLISKVIMERNKDKDFVQRAYALGKNPGTAMFNAFDPDEFGQTMSHKMAWGEDDNGQAYMFPTVMNPKNETIKVPNQYADYISNEGYKKATGMISEESYQDGGDLPKDVSLSYLKEGDRSYYDPRMDSIYLDPNASEDELNHEMAHAWQNRNGLFRSDPYSPKLRPSTAASDEQAADYFNRKGDDVDRYLRNLKTIVPNLGGHTWNEDLDRFIPEQVKYDKEIDPLMYFDPTTLEGEAEYMSQVYGKPDNIGIKQQGGYIEAELTDDEIENYRKGGYIVEDISVPELNQAQSGKFVAPQLPRDRTKSETTQMVSLPARQAIQHINNKPGADEIVKAANEAVKKDNKKQQAFKKEQWKEYKKLPLSEKISDRLAAFVNDPAGMTSRALLGEQAYIPGMAQGLHNYENPEIRNRYLKELGYTPGEFDAYDVQNMVNPGSWVTSFTENVRKGNVGDAALEGVLTALPFLPKGIFKGSNIKSGANLLKNDVKNAGEYLTKSLSKTKPKKTTNIDLNINPGDSFTPIRIGGKKYKNAGQEWFTVDPGDYPGMTWEETQKQGLQDAGESLNYLFKKNPNYSKETFDNVGDFNFKQFSEGDNALRDLYAKLSKQKQLTKDDFYTDKEVLKLADKYKKHLENLESFDKSNPLDPAEMMLNFFTGKGNARDELFNILHPNSFQPSFREKFLTPAQEQLLKHYNFRTGDKGSLEKNSLKNFGDMFFKPQQNIELPSVKKLKEFDNPDHFFFKDPKMVVSEMRGSLGLSFDDIKKLSSEELLNYRNEVINKLKKQAVDRVNENLKNKFTGPKAWQELIKNPGYYNKLGGLIQAQKGIISTKEHTDKKGNKTIVVTKDDGTKYTKVIGKNGKVYNKTTPGMSPYALEQAKKQGEWNAKSSDGRGEADGFWQIPIGIGTSGVKLSVGLAKGIAESSLAQATKAGSKALFNTSIKNLPGANLKNLINAGFVGSGVNEYMDENSDVRRSIRNAYDNPTGDNVSNAIYENALNSLNFSGLNVGKNVKQLGKYAKNIKPAEYKNYYRIEPTTFKKDLSDDISGRWFGEKDQMPFYIKNLKDPEAGVRVMRKKMKTSDWEKISGKNMPDEAKLMSEGTGEYNTFQEAAAARLIDRSRASRLTAGVHVPSDREFLASNKSLYNRKEGVISEKLANKIRTNKKINPFSSWNRTEFNNDPKKNAMDYLFNKQNYEKNILGIPRKYIPFQKGGVVAELTQDEIDKHIAQGYIVEEINDEYQVGGENDPNSAINKLNRKKEALQKNISNTPIIVNTPVSTINFPEPVATSIAKPTVTISRPINKPINRPVVTPVNKPIKKIIKPIVKPVINKPVITPIVKSIKKVIKPIVNKPIVKTFEKSKEKVKDTLNKKQIIQQIQTIKKDLKVVNKEVKQPFATEFYEKFAEKPISKNITTVKTLHKDNKTYDDELLRMKKAINAGDMQALFSGEEPKPKPLFENSNIEKEILDRQKFDNAHYGKFDTKGDDIMNRTAVKRNRDSEIFFANKATNNSVIIDIGSALGNNDATMAGVSVWELANNPKIKKKGINVIATDLPDQVKDFKKHIKNKKAYPIDYAEVPQTFNTPIADILKSKKLDDKKDIYLRAANSIDLLMNNKQAIEHLNHIAKTLKNKNVTYLYNNVILFKSVGETTFKKLGNLNNAGFDHNSKSWLKDENRTPYFLNF